MAFNFPNSPAINDTHTENGVTWRWDGVAWNKQGTTPYTTTDFESDFANQDTDDLTEGASNLYYTDTRVNSAIDTRVDKTFVDGLNVDADTLDGEDGAHYLDYNNFTNTPSIPGDTDDLTEGASNLYYTDTRANSAIDARVDKTFVDALNADADTLDGLDSADFVQLTGDQTINGLKSFGDGVRIEVDNGAATLIVRRSGSNFPGLYASKPKTGALANGDLTGSIGLMVQHDSGDVVPGLIQGEYEDGNNKIFLSTVDNGTTSFAINPRFIVSSTGNTSQVPFNVNFPTGGGVEISEEWGPISEVRGIAINGGDTDWPALQLKEYAQNAPFGGVVNPLIFTSIFGGTESSPSGLGSGVNLLSIEGFAADETGGTPSDPNARIRFQTTETQDSVDGRGTGIFFYATANGDLSPVETFTITGDQVEAKAQLKTVGIENVATSYESSIVQTGSENNATIHSVKSGSQNLDGTGVYRHGQFETAIFSSEDGYHRGASFNSFRDGNFGDAGSIKDFVEIASYAYSTGTQRLVFKSNSDRVWLLRDRLTFDISGISDTAEIDTTVDFIKVNKPFVLPAYNSGSLPGGDAGAMIAISNNSHRPAYYDGSAWRYVHDNSAV